MIRPQPARWFEIVIAAGEVLPALEALAASGCVEFEAPRNEIEPASEELDRLLAEHRAVAAKYRPYLPQPRLAPGVRASASDLARSACGRLRTWAAGAEPAIERLQAIEAELGVTLTWERVLSFLDSEKIPPQALAGAGPQLEAALFIVPRGAALSMPDGIVEKRWDPDSEEYVLCAGTPAAVREVSAGVGAAQGRRIPVPPWLAPLRDQSIEEARRRHAQLEAEAQALSRSIQAAAEKHRVAEALGDIARAAWYLRCTGALEAGVVLCRIRGWTDDAQRLEAALERSSTCALIHFPEPATGTVPPLVLRNPPWARPFELFTRLLGMPAQNSADPSALLILVAPLLFGYMFGDVGQGLLLLAAGAIAGRRWPQARILVAGGLAAAVFGLAFGSVFSLEGVIEPLWLDPMEEPLRVLAAPLAGGFLLLLAGASIGALEAQWAGTLKRWLIEDAGPLAAYIGAVVLLRSAAGWALIALGLAVSTLGQALSERRLHAVVIALGEFAEKVLQLGVNTVSFVRVGAFALAHAGLSSAVVSCSEAMDSAYARVLVLVFGNVLVMALEVLAVSIQTTRLVLFEFFVRFFDARGREFRPAAPPQLFFQEKPHEANS